MVNEKRITPALRQSVRTRAEGYCEYCRCHDSFCIVPFVVEHIYPRTLGGATTLPNLAYACGGCNGHKGAKIQAPDRLTGELVQLFHPRQQQWADHFIWSEDTTRILSVTSIGRATVEALHLNRLAVINLRQVLHVVGKHPPVDSPEIN